MWTNRKRPQFRSTQCAGAVLLFLAAPSVYPAALQWTDHPGYRIAAVAPPAGKTGFTMPQDTGVNFTNVIPAERHYTNQILLNGSGVAAGDVDGDGWCDLFFCGLGGGSALYRNLGQWKFEDATANSELAAACARLDATGAALADLDGDRDLDLLLNSVGQGTLCFLNSGAGKFTPAATPLLNAAKGGMSLGLADVDGDGALDVYIANYRTSTIRDQPGARFTFKSVDGKPQPTSFGGRPLTDPDLTNRFAFVYQPGSGSGGSVFHDELGEADVLYRNEGGGRFVSLAGSFHDEQGRTVPLPLDWGLAVLLRDLNGDGAPDIYVCNDFATPDRFWLNDGKGRFRPAPDSAIRQTSLSAMAVDVADVNRDGHDDLFTADMLSRDRWRRLVQHNAPNPNIHLFFDVERQQQSARNTFQLARGDGTYAEAAQWTGLEASEWAWASVFVDVDLDGYEDLLIANGFERDYMNMDAHRKVSARQSRASGLPLAEVLQLNRHYPRLDTPNVAFRNLGSTRFADVSSAWGFDLRAVSQGMCLADLDNDGDLDVAINNSNQRAALLRNETAAPRVAVRLAGKGSNTRGIGARIKLLHGAVPTQSQEMICGGRYLSSDDAMRVFAAGWPTNHMTLEVAWRSGARSVVTGVVANRIYEITETGGTSAVAADAPRVAPLFKDVSAALNHRHQEASFDDFARQPLLPYKLSTGGPGITWFDVDTDGWDDLIVAASKGSPMAVFHNDRAGGFTRSNQETDHAPRAQTSVLGAVSSNGNATLVAGLSNYEEGKPAPAAARYSVVTEKQAPLRIASEPPSAPSAATTGPLALADVDGDNRLDLFVGGRCVPGRWPEPAPSLLWRGGEGKWLPDDENTQRLAKVGLVSGAVWTDLDGDGDPELALACEWGPLRVFRNDGGVLNEATTEMGLNAYTGLWKGVAAGDFDGDGRMDMIASNHGRNTQYEWARGTRSSDEGRLISKPLRLYYGDFNEDGGLALLESWHDPALKDYAPTLNVWTMSRGMPWLLERFNSYEAFSRASIPQVLGERGRVAKYLEASWLESMVFLNRGGRFEARELPYQAQLAPAFALCVADFDGDGREDVFLSQNFFGTRPGTSRHDAGRGLLLTGTGQGAFEAVSGQNSGLVVYGEQRGAAAADYNRDGRMDLAVSQRGAETKLYRNEAARPGLRVRLTGPGGNPSGIGAHLRLKAGDQLGPVREIHAGAGYWSQDSAVQVLHPPQLTSPGATITLQVKWPGGKLSAIPVPANAREMSVDFDGAIRNTR